MIRIRIFKSKYEHLGTKGYHYFLIESDTKADYNINYGNFREMHFRNLKIYKLLPIFSLYRTKHENFGGFSFMKPFMLTYKTEDINDILRPL